MPYFTPDATEATGGPVQCGRETIVTKIYLMYFCLYLGSTMQGLILIPVQ